MTPHGSSTARRAAASVSPPHATPELGELSQLTARWFRFEIEFERPAQLGRFAGNAFRGGFGLSLRRQICPSERLRCERCELQPHCSFAQIFDAREPDPTAPPLLRSDVPQPFALRIGELRQEEDGGAALRQPWAEGVLPADRPIALDLLLVGQAQGRLETCVAALRRLGHQGLREAGSHGQHSRFRMRRVRPLRFDSAGSMRAEPVPMQLHGREALPDTLRSPRPLLLQRELESPAMAEAMTSPEPLRIEFPNGLHLKQRGKFAPEPSLRDLLLATLRRYTRLLYYHGIVRAEELSPKLPRWISSEAQIPLLDRDTEVIQLDRYSQRKRRNQRFLALRGHWTLPPAARRFYPLLLLAERLGTGKGSTFGLGELRIVHGGACKSSSILKGIEE